MLDILFDMGLEDAISDAAEACLENIDVESIGEIAEAFAEEFAEQIALNPVLIETFKNTVL